MKEISQAIEARIKSPVWLYLIFSFLSLNWRQLFILLKSEESAVKKIEYFNSNTDFLFLVAYPVILATLLAGIYPWATYCILWISKKPTAAKTDLQNTMDHDYLLKQQEFERTRNEKQAEAERALLEQAKRDGEINQIKDEDVRQNVKDEIRRLRTNESESSEKLPQHLREEFVKMEDSDRFKELFKHKESLLMGEGLDRMLLDDSSDGVAVRILNYNQEEDKLYLTEKGKQYFKWRFIHGLDH